MTHTGHVTISVAWSLVNAKTRSRSINQSSINMMACGTFEHTNILEAVGAFLKTVAQMTIDVMTKDEFDHDKDSRGIY